MFFYFGDSHILLEKYMRLTHFTFKYDSVGILLSYVQQRSKEIHINLRQFRGPFRATSAAAAS